LQGCRFNLILLDQTLFYNKRADRQGQRKHSQLAKGFFVSRTSSPYTHIFKISFQKTVIFFELVTLMGVRQN